MSSDAEQRGERGRYTLEDSTGRCLICLCDIEGSHGTNQRAPDGSDVTFVDFCYACGIDCGAAQRAGLRLRGWMHESATEGPPHVGHHSRRGWRRGHIDPKLCSECYPVLVPSGVYSGSPDGSTDNCIECGHDQRAHSEVWVTPEQSGLACAKCGCEDYARAEHFGRNA